MHTKPYLILKNVDSTINMEKREFEMEEVPLLKASATYLISSEWEEAEAQEVDVKDPKKENLFLNL